MQRSPVGGRKAFKLGDTVARKDKTQARWALGTVTQLHPQLLVSAAVGGTEGHSWDQTRRPTAQETTAEAARKVAEGYQGAAALAADEAVGAFAEDERRARALEPEFRHSSSVFGMA